MVFEKTTSLLPEGAKITPMMQQWVEAKKKAKDALLLFRMGDFYEMFAKDAEEAAPILDLALTSRDKESKEKRVSMAGFPHHSAAQYIAKLIAHGFKVAICDQTEDPKKAKGIVKRDVTQIVTPGTAVDENSLSPGNNNFLVAIAADSGCFSLAALDMSTGEFIVTQTISSELLLDELIKLSPSEVLYREGTLPADFLQLIKDISVQKNFRLEVSAKEVSRSELSKHLEPLDEWFSSKSNELCLESSGLILSFLEETQGEMPGHITSLKPYSIDAHLLIDSTSCHHLSLVGPKSDVRKAGTLLWVLDKTRTSMGARKLKRWLLSPSTDVLEIERRHQYVEALVEDAGCLKAIRTLLKSVYDLERLQAKVGSKRVNPRELAQLRNSLQRLPELEQVLLSSNFNRLNSHLENTGVLEDVYSILEKALVYDPPISAKDGGIFRPKHDSVLDELISLSQGGRDKIALIEQREKESTGIPSLKVKYTRVFGYYIEVTRTHLSKVPDYYRRKQTIANGERYVTEELSRLEEEVATAEVRKQNREIELFETLKEQLSKCAKRMRELAAATAELDALSAFAEVADRLNYVKPKIQPMDIQQTIVVEARHPVAEVLSQQRNETFVPNTVRMKRDKDRLLLITGPNMAGKSTIMRQVALLQIMAQAGSFVPAESATLSICDRIFTRVGASDDLMESRSTFMVEMTETAHILKHATPNSLVILDEIGRGTSTFDGLSLAFAVAEYLHDVVQARTLFATHYHELVELTHDLNGVKNMQVAVQERTEGIAFMYRLIEGAAEQSYGIHVAKLAGLPKAVIEKAEVILEQLEKAEHLNQGDKQTPRFCTSQLDLFGKALFDEKKVTELLECINKINVNETTPIAALGCLERIKELTKAVL